MNEKVDKKEVQKLAKKSLKEKLYPLRKGKKDIRRDDHCAFCEDIKVRRETIKRRSGEAYCSICYIDILMPGFCFEISHRVISSVIKVLEQLSEYGTTLKLEKNKNDIYIGPAKVYRDGKLVK